MHFCDRYWEKKGLREQKKSPEYSDMGSVVFSYEDGNYYAQYGDDEASKKVLGEIEKAKLIEALSASGLGLTLQSTPDQIYTALMIKFPKNKFVFYNGFQNGFSYSSKDNTPTSNKASTSVTGNSLRMLVYENAGNLIVTINPAIDISSVDKISVEISVSGNYTYTNYIFFAFGIATTVGTAPTYNKKITAFGTGKYTIEYDVNHNSISSGNYYINMNAGFSAGNGGAVRYAYIDITKMELTMHASS